MCREATGREEPPATTIKNKKQEICSGKAGYVSRSHREGGASGDDYKEQKNMFRQSRICVAKPPCLPNRGNYKVSSQSLQKKQKEERDFFAT
jgi:hypothetical protein